MEQECFGSPDYKTLFIFYTCISLLKVASVKKKNNTATNSNNASLFSKSQKTELGLTELQPRCR